MIQVKQHTKHLLIFIECLRPGEPPTKESTEILFNNLFFLQIDMMYLMLERMKINWRLKIEDALTLCKEDIVRHHEKTC